MDLILSTVAHQITALRAVENAMNIQISNQTRQLRKLIAISAHIQSNVLSMFFLSLPDLMGYESLIAMTKEHIDIVKMGLNLKKLVNDITQIIGGRSVHPVTMIVGGFTSIPNKNKFEAIYKRLEDAKKDAFKTFELFSNLEIPDFSRKCEHIAISNPKQYAINEGRFKSTEGLNIDEINYRNHIYERQKPYSTALHSYIRKRDSFMVGPLPRVNLNWKQMSDDARNTVDANGVKFPNFNPFVSHLARSIELIHDIDECIDIIRGFSYKEEKPSSIICKSGFGAAITEAPRGSLYHSYIFDNNGIVKKADIVPPTAHNVYNIERDMTNFVQKIVDSPLDEISLKCEMLVRAYDPCISCSSH
jgi:coenzyme F420-reducing hydrogenase alpha subunit